MVNAKAQHTKETSEMKGTEDKNKIRISVIGGKHVGKSALTVRYLTKRFIGEYNSNSDMIYHQTLPGNPAVELEIVDISTPTVPSEMSFDGIILTYSITDKSSFEFATNALSLLSALYPLTLPPMALVGNKCDLIHVRAVEKSDGGALASQFGIQFYELSVAENSPEVHASFNSIVNSCVKPPAKRRFSMSKILRRIGKMSLSNSNHQRQHSDSSSESSFDGNSNFPCRTSPRVATFTLPQKGIANAIECS